MGAFHAYDIRGIYGKDLDAEFAYKAGYFLPRLLKTGKVLVGMDMRESSPILHEALVRGITDAGADVYDLGLSTTPMVYYATATKGFEASVQITASHNPKEYNGLKVSRRDALPVGLDSGLGELRDLMESGEPTPVAGTPGAPAAQRGKVIPFDLTEEYISFLTGYKRDISNLRIAMDCSNGMACNFVRRIFGDQPHYICDTLDGTFPNHEANPLLSECREMLCRKVLEEGCDVGVIYDGDADRVMFVDENGSFISPDLIIALLGNYFLKEKGLSGKVLQDIRSSKAVGEYLAPMGGEICTWKVGRAFAAPRLREIDGIFGGELAGHYYFRDFFYSDSGLLASILVLGILADFKRKGKNFSRVMSTIARYENSGEINFEIGDKTAAMEAVRSFFTAQEKPVASYDFDGYRVEFNDWWFNIRPSNTEPYLRFICEAASKQLLEQKIETVRGILAAYEA